MDHNEMEQALKEVRAGDINQFGLIIDAMQKIGTPFLFRHTLNPALTKKDLLMIAEKLK
ncbi:hypothetical protein ACFVS2_14085 [Brevibacillus sp. NPDC058079]|uniref:hypothetical protein n=1 Tax=Brevibacillus sp. NPDC058079 TaxID=3346330 RepID=UPI0036E9EB33